jgi:hypothetical protein
VLVVAFYVAIACAWWWPLPAHLLHGQVEHPPIDSAYNQWILGWGAHALTTNPLHYFDANAYYPLRGVLAWGDHLVGLALLVVPLRPIFGLVGAYNVLLLGSTALSGYGCYLLVRLLSGRRAIAVLAGAVWASSAYRVIEYSHLQTLSTEWTPFVFYFGEQVRRRGRPLHLLGLVASAWLVLATNVYLAVFTVLTFAIYAVVVLARRRIDLPAVLRIGIAWAVAIVLAAPLYVPGIRLQSQRHIVRTLAEQSPSTLEALRPLPPPGHMAQILSDRIGDRLVYRGNYATPGLLLLAMSAVAVGVLVVAAVRRRHPGVDVRAALAFAAVGVFGVASAQGPELTWYGRALASNPFFLLPYHHVPGYDALRVPHRWLLFGMFGLAVAAATVVAPLLDRLPRLVRIGLVVVASGLTLIELAPAPWVVTRAYSDADEPVYAWLRHQPDGPILEMPISADLASAVTQELEAKRMFYSASHFRPRVGGGVSPYIPPEYSEQALLMDQLGREPEAMADLRKWHVRFVLFDATDQARFPTAEPATAVLARLDAEPGLRRVTTVGDTTVYRVRP